jgi:hypothetical protein
MITVVSKYGRNLVSSKEFKDIIDAQVHITLQGRNNKATKWEVDEIGSPYRYYGKYNEADGSITYTKRTIQ